MWEFGRTFSFPVASSHSFFKLLSFGKAKKGGSLLRQDEMQQVYLPTL